MDIVDLGNTPEVYADELCAALFLGDHLRITFCSWKLIAGIVRRVAVLDLVRPLSAIPPDVQARWRALTSPVQDERFLPH